MGVGTRAIEEVYRRRYGAFLRVAIAIERDPEAAHDAVQEAFARAIKARRSFRAAGPLEAWLWRTLVNVCLDGRRRAQRIDPLDELPAEDGDDEEWPELRAAVALLPRRQRLVLFLRHYADLDYEAIAAALGISRGTVAATLHAAHASLRRSMTEVLR
jgi:RNA polymerase sigma factor (sigma-70 family)